MVHSDILSRQVWLRVCIRIRFIYWVSCWNKPCSAIFLSNTPEHWMMKHTGRGCGGYWCEMPLDRSQDGEMEWKESSHSPVNSRLYFTGALSLCVVNDMLSKCALCVCSNYKKHLNHICLLTLKIPSNLTVFFQGRYGMSWLIHNFWAGRRLAFGTCL